MTTVDELFKKSSVPSKRKQDSIQDPREVYKNSKLEPETPVPVGGNTTPAAEPLPPPADGNEYGPEPPPDDDEGRFFGGGLTQVENEVLDYVDGVEDGDEPAKIDIGWMRKTAQNLEKRMGRNAELRAKFEDDPQKFILSEADLDAEIRGLSLLSEHAGLYPEFVRLGCAARLVGLLAHENTDIAIDAAEVIGYLTDESSSADDSQWNALVDAMLEADLVDLLVSNLARLDEEDDADSKGVFHCLGILENLCSRQATSELIGRQEPLLKWLLGRAQKEEPAVSQNKQYSAEILAILSQQSAGNRRALAALDGIDALLQLVAFYRKWDPRQGGDEEEYMGDLFEALTCIVDEEEGKAKFVEAEGVELCLIMLKDGKASKAPALRLLDHAAGGSTAGGVCEKIVETGGLKTIFTVFMKKNDSKTLEHLLAVFSSMLRLLPANSAGRIRTLAKFVEKDYEKVGRLVKLRRDFGARVEDEEKKIQAEQEQSGLRPDSEEAAALESESLVRRLDAGLFCQNMIDVILAWLVAEDDGLRRQIQRNLVADTGQDLPIIRQSLEAQVEALDPDQEESKELQEMMTTLIECLG